jgi:hypothetical protein
LRLQCRPLRPRFPSIDASTSRWLTTQSKDLYVELGNLILAFFSSCSHVSIFAGSRVQYDENAFDMGVFARYVEELESYEIILNYLREAGYNVRLL